MSRQARHGLLPWLEPGELDAQQLAYYQALTSSARAGNAGVPLVDEYGRLNGPFNPFLSTPEVGVALERLGSSLRFPGRLPPVVFETVVLMVAATRRASYEWYAHAPLALDAGLSIDQIAAVQRGDDSALAGTVPSELPEIVRAALQHREPTEEAVVSLSDRLGAGAVTEIVVTAAFYDLLATVMRTWRSPMPAGIPDPFEIE